MSYTGDVRVGGPVDVQRLDALTIRKIAVGALANNAYLLTCAKDGIQLLIDPADNSEALLELIRKGSDISQLDQVVVTHQHADHIGALAPVVAATGAPVATGADDAQSIREQTGVLINQRLTDGDVINFGSCSLSVVHLRGHTPGSVALVYQDEASGTHIFTGDSLFPGGVGKTASSADFSSLLDDVETRLFDRFDDATWIYPGHGSDTTLGVERPQLAMWRERGW